MNTTIESILEFSRTVEGQGTEDHQNCTYTTAELRVLIEQAVSLPRGACVVEIGVYVGRSASIFLQLQPELDLDVHLIDNWSWHQPQAQHRFVDMIVPRFNEVPFTFHKMLSTHAVRKFVPGVHLVHIDGWHDLPGIEPDCQAWLPIVRSGGLAAFHDSDCEPIKYCIDKYVKQQGWSFVSEGGRTTIWRKP